MTKDPKSVERKGTPARKSGPASKGQSKGQVKEHVNEQVQRSSTTTTPLQEKVVALAAAAMLTLPLAVTSTPVEAQSAASPPINPTAPVLPNETTKAAGQEGTLIIRMERTFTVLGVGDGHTIFKDAAGAVFHIDPATGDRQELAADYFLNSADSKGERGAGKIKFTNVMIVSILGADAHGNTVMRNARNETFTLEPRTGTKVLIKWPK